MRYGPRWLRNELSDRQLVKRGQTFGATLTGLQGDSLAPANGDSELESYFDAHLEGPGIFKWRHYFPIYERYLARFRGREARLLEIGVYSGGSLRMWREYLGPQSRIIGVDIEPSCKAYETDGIEILIGDQGDALFWQRFVDTQPPLDAVIDDGSHEPEDQITTLTALLPYVRPGGVYIVEDVHGTTNRFARFVDGLTRNLDAGGLTRGPGDELSVTAGPLQRAVAAIHRYPFVTVLERNAVPVAQLECVRRGTEWQPY